MAKHITRWHPDTCGCVVEYSWDDEVSEDDRTHTFSSVVETCAAHQHLPHPLVFAAVADENPRKNRVLARLAELHPEKRRKVADADGTQRDDWRPGEEPDWSFDKDRVLEVRVKGLTAGKRTASQAALDAEHGAGKTRIR